MLSEIQPAGTEQRPIFAVEPEVDTPERLALMAAMDATNRRFGKRTVVGLMGTPAALRRTREASGAPGWERRRQHMSPRYTTRWNELAVARA